MSAAPVTINGVAYANGTVPTYALAIVPGYNPDHSPHRLHPDAAAALGRLIAAARAAEFALMPSPGYSTYRSRLDQQHMRDIGLTTIPVGRSIHGEGRAIDLYDVGGFDGPFYAWLAANGPAHGFYQPTWARKRGALPEFWHWEYDPDLDQHIPIPAPVVAPAPAPIPTPPSVQEDDMLPLILWCYDRLVGRPASTDEIVNQLRANVGRTPAQVVDGFLAAKAEPASHVKAYQDYLHRPPVQADIDLRATMTIGQVRDALRAAAAAGAK